MITITYYDILEVSQNASSETIHAAYKALCKKYHPDVSSLDSDERMKEVNHAYEILSDPEKRSQYDRELRAEHSQASHNERVRYTAEESSPSQNKTSTKTTSDSKNGTEKTSLKPSEVIVGLIYLLFSGIGQVIYFILGIIVLLFIIGLFTGHSQQLIGTVFQTVEKMIMNIIG